EINFNKFLKSVRKSQKASLVKATYGVCSKSAMSKVEKGTRLPEKLVRDRLTARLGISGEEYEEYLITKEYQQWQARMDIIRSINRKEIDETEEKIKAYEKKYCRNKVQKQFVATMRYLLFELKGYSRETRLKQISKAMKYTIPDMEKAFAGAQLLADQELNIIMEYISLCDEKTVKENLAEWQLKNYKEIDNYVQKSYMDKIAQAKVYSKLACHVCELVFVKFKDEENMRYALDLCTRAIEVLRDTVRLYYFMEINEFRIRLMKTLNIENLEDNEEYQDGVAWTELFHELHEENETKPYMDNFTYLYTETECNDAAEVIRIRRKMMGLSMNKLGEMTSSERTILRLETRDGNPHIETLREVLGAVGLCAEFKRARVVTSDAEAMRLSEVLYVQINSGEYEKASETHKKLFEILDLNISFNSQEMKRTQALILRGLKQIEKEEHCRLLEDIMKSTIDFDKLKNVEKKYLSRIETYCMQNLVGITKGEDVEVCKNYLEDECEKIMHMDELDVNRLCTYEMIMYCCANYLGNKGMYTKSVEISRKLLKESLRNRRSAYLPNCIYNELWTKQEMMERERKSIDSQFENKTLHKGLMVSKLIKRDNWKRFFQQKLEL
ncbi:MAG: hypothetical protein IJ958_09860, partial [Agathobacter sp.]|nr:hypothetical protein [Agathobacter sp.]